MATMFMRRGEVIRTLSLPPEKSQAVDRLCMVPLLPHLQTPAGGRFIVGAYVRAYAAFLSRSKLGLTTPEYAEAFATTPEAQRIDHEAEVRFNSKLTSKSIYSIRMLAELLDVKEETIKSWIRKGGLRTERPSKARPLAIIPTGAILEACEWRSIQLRRR
jgi:hypothetical protein